MLFSVLPEEVRRFLEDSAATQRFEGGQIIQQRGDQPDGFWVIESGSIAVGQFLASGEFRGVALLGPGDSWGELAMFASRPRVVDAVARSPSAVRHIRADLFDAAIERHPQALHPLLSALSEQLQETLDVVAGIRRGSAQARLAGLLASLSRDEPLPSRLAISQQELGELLGLTRATVNKALGEFEERALIARGYGFVEVRKREALRQLALG